MRVEALSRVTAEAELIKRHDLAFQRLLKTHDDDRVAAVAALVTKRGKEYGQLVTAARERLRTRGAA